MASFLTPEDLRLLQDLNTRLAEAHRELGAIDTNDKRVCAAMYWALMAVPMLDTALVARPPRVRASLLQWGGARLQEAHNGVAKVVLGERLNAIREGVEGLCGECKHPMRDHSTRGCHVDTGAGHFCGCAARGDA